MLGMPDHAIISFTRPVNMSYGFGLFFWIALLLCLHKSMALETKLRCETNGTEFRCDNGKCIHNSTRCLGFNPCGDKSDCKSVESEETTLYFGFIKAIVDILPYAAGLAGMAIIYHVFNILRRTSCKEKRHAPILAREDSSERLQTENNTSVSEPRDQDTNQDSHSVLHLNESDNSSTDSYEPFTFIPFFSDTRGPGAPPDYYEVMNTPVSRYSSHGTYTNNSHPLQPKAPTTPTADYSEGSDDADYLSTHSSSPPRYEHVMSNQSIYRILD